MQYAPDNGTDPTTARKVEKLRQAGIRTKILGLLARIFQPLPWYSFGGPT